MIIRRYVETNLQCRRRWQRNMKKLWKHLCLISLIVPVKENYRIFVDYWYKPMSASIANSNLVLIGGLVNRFKVSEIDIDTLKANLLASNDNYCQFTLTVFDTAILYEKKNCENICKLIKNLWVFGEQNSRGKSVHSGTGVLDAVSYSFCSGPVIMDVNFSLTSLTCTSSSFNTSVFLCAFIEAEIYTFHHWGD